MSQVITPQLREWIISQAQAGFPADTVLKSMLASGWQEDVAIQAMESTLQEHLKATQQAAALPTPMTVPELAVEDSPLYLQLEDRKVSVLTAMSDPNIVVIGNFLSDEECDGLIEGAKPRMARSLTVETKSGGEELNADRTSNGMFYARAENELIARIERRLAQLTRWPVENGEGLQILHYHPGAEYKPHYDYFDPHEPGTPTILKRGGQRVATIIMYLHEPEAGGGTVFPDVRLTVAPKKGHAVFFSYNRAHPITKSLHGGEPVVRGQKWVATKWLREGKFT
ncbi:2OG-Fe(II) oxygenase [Variovorax sp. PCZ-1]|uniref:2OG-Fe(II) oxygenase n=1 Tax=Variovorax sp. PCZ-1 TaxID=2835533 RepID=UPI001BCF471C|nr:2OG-Fe(II) oxygenase [Variovorax sp. PCZ-1]MBS7808458.1 2OG-Fe(II) oxygenase [Variovorax sp. PCZ-1]